MTRNPSKIWQWAISERAQVRAECFAEDYGLFPGMLRALPSCCMGALPVNTDCNGFFEVDPAGNWMIAVATEITFEGEAVDIICFDPAQPRDLFRYTGNAIWLGFNELHRRSDPYFAGFIGPVCADNSITDEPLCLTWNALSWIRSAGASALPLDRTAYHDLICLRQNVEIICDEKPGAVEIYKFISRPPADLPRILYDRAASEVAA